MDLSNVLEQLTNPQSLWRQSFHQDLNSNAERFLSLSKQFPAVDLYPVEAGWELKADLPGIDRAGVSLVIEDDVLTLSGKRNAEVDRNVESFHYSERHYGGFTRKINLPYRADPTTVTAKFVDGVLIVLIPHPTTSSSGQITID